MQGPDMQEEDGHIAQINIIPLVDVVLVLLIIFIVTAVFTNESGVKLDLPKGSRAEQVKQPPAEITVSVNEKSQVFVNGKPCPLSGVEKQILTLKDELAGTDGKVLVVLRGDRKMIYGDLMPVLDEVSRTGIQLTLALQPGPPDPK